jgi:histidyl-tRNA synthetase
MARSLKNFKIELNSADNLRDLLQQIIDLADEQLIQIQAEIEKLKNSTDLTQEPMDGKAKYAKAINDFLSIKDKTVSKKIDVAKMLNDVMAHNGDVKATLEDSNSSSGGFDLQSLRDELEKMDERDSIVKTINLKK